MDLTAPAGVVWPPLRSLKVGVPVTATPSSTHTDIASYSVPNLPPGLVMAADTGVISGTPTTATSRSGTRYVTVTDRAGNEARELLSIPLIARGDQPT